MKAILLNLAALLVLTGTALAQSANGSFTFTPSSQTVTPGQPFNVTLGYTGSTPPADAASYDLYLVTAAGNASLFKITADAAGSPWTIPSGTLPVGGSSFSTASPAASGWAVNDTDLGFGGADQTAPYNFSNLATLTIQTGALTPGATYTFFSSSTAKAGFLFSDLADNQANDYEVPESSFTITAAVPEPSTLALVGLGGLGLLTSLRRRAK